LKAGGGLLIDGLLKAAFVLGVLVAESFDGVATFFLFLGVYSASASATSKSKSSPQSSNATPALLAFATAACKGSTNVIPLALSSCASVDIDWQTKQNKTKQNKTNKSEQIQHKNRMDQIESNTSIKLYIVDDYLPLQLYSNCFV
jgi:hypothetical protein